MKRDPDAQEYHQRWAATYDDLNYGRSLSSTILYRTHKIIEKKFSGSGTPHLKTVLEVGAGSGVHFDFVKHDFEKYYMTEYSQDFLSALAKKFAGDRRVEVLREDAAALSFADRSVDRLVACHVLEHLYRPHEVLREWHRVVRPGGYMSLILPCDPGIAWRLGRMLGPRRSATRAGILYDYWMAREHVNPINNLVTFIRYYFDLIEEHWWPLGVPSIDGNLIYGVNITVR